MRPSLKTVPWLKEGNEVIVAVNPTPGDLRRFPDSEGEITRVMRSADGSRTTAEIADDVDLSADKVESILSALDDAGLLVDADSLIELTAEERGRWRNNLEFLEAFARMDHSPMAYYRDLRHSRVLLLGVGGLGSMMLMNLAGLGVREIVVVDFDEVEPANLTRQFVYRESDVGLPKVERAQAWVGEFTGHTEITTVARKITSADDVYALLDGIDLVVSAIDQPTDAPLWVNQACVRAEVPCLYGGFFFSKGRYESVWPGHSGCLACLVLGEVLDPEPINRAIGPSVSIVAGLMAMEAVRYLTGFTTPVSAGQTWIVDFADGGVTPSLRWGRSPECPVCGTASGRQVGKVLDGQILPNALVDVAHLTMVADGDEYLVGDLARGTFLAIPPVGATALEVLQHGGTIAEATVKASAFAGTDVNVLEFVGVLRDRGLVRGTGDEAAAQVEAEWSASQAKPITVLARILFSRAAWVVYAVAMVFGLCTLLVDAALRPTWESIIFLPDPALSLLVDIVTTVALAGVHEAFHWLGAQRFGLPARFRVSRRGLFLVFETDLSRLWAVPRRQRYPAFFAGMAFDGLVLGTCLAVRLAYQQGWITMPATLNRFLAMIVLTQMITLTAQLFLFMRTDLYAAMITALGCRNLYRVSMLIVKARLIGLTEAQRTELAAASERDRRIGRWFSGLYLVGVLGLSYLLFGLFVPAAFSMIQWSVLNVLSTSPNSLLFWEAFAVALFFSAEMLWPPAHWALERLRRRAARRALNPQGTT